ncbi:MAG: rod-binding protein [Planctomycetaceae bacterium]|nr:rod-binding protein [Planctomycetaceae bacterium]
MDISSISSLSSLTPASTKRNTSLPSLPPVVAQAKKFDMTDTLELTGKAPITRNEETPKPKRELTEEDKEFRDVMHKLVGEVLYGTMMKQFRESQEPDPYFGGGRGEELFQSQLDQIYVEKMSNASSNNISDAMFNQMQRIMGKAEV